MQGKCGDRHPDPEEEEEEDSGLPGVPQAPQVQAGKGPSPSQTKLTQPSEASKQDVSDDLSKKSSSSKLVPESLFTLDSSDDEMLHRLPHLPHHSI